MIKKNKLKELCLSGDESKARAIILTHLDNNRFQKDIFPLTISSLSEIQGLLIDDNNLYLELDEDKWDYTYWTMMCVELSNNFSRNKLEHILEVTRFLRKKEDPKFMPVKLIRKKSLKKSTKREEVIHHNNGYCDKLLPIVIKLPSKTISTLKGN
jgi:hypothetical protein